MKMSQKKLAWLLGDDTGLSSKTIFAVMNGIEFKHNAPPRDPSDMGKCFRLLTLFPHWKSRLNEVAELYPEWKVLIDNWKILYDLYCKELPSGNCPRTYTLMNTLTQYRI